MHEQHENNSVFYKMQMKEVQLQQNYPTCRNVWLANALQNTKKIPNKVTHQQNLLISWIYWKSGHMKKDMVEKQEMK